MRAEKIAENAEELDVLVPDGKGDAPEVGDADEGGDTSEDGRYLSPDEIDLSSISLLGRYPLPAKEIAFLAFGIVFSNALMVIGALLFLVPIPNLTVPLRDAISTISSSSLAPLDPAAFFSPRTWIVCVAGAGLMSLIGFICEDAVMERSEPYRKEMLENLRGITGEIARLPKTALVPLMLCVGIGEESFFRFSFTAVVMWCLSFLSDSLPESVYWCVAIAVSIAFTFAHTNYKTWISRCQVFSSGAILAAVFALSGSLLASMLVHAAYDYIALMWARHKMMSREDPFEGKVPARLATFDAKRMSRKDEKMEQNNTENR